MNNKRIDKTKKANIKCENCEHWRKEKDGFLFITYCKLTKEKKKYYQRCKMFEWGMEVEEWNGDGIGELEMITNNTK
jgi:hypothetical protein